MDYLEPPRIVSRGCDNYKQALEHRDATGDAPNVHHLSYYGRYKVCVQGIDI